MKADDAWDGKTTRAVKTAPPAIVDAGNIKAWVADPTKWRDTLDLEIEDITQHRKEDEAFLKETEYVPVLLYNAVRVKQAYERHS